jgi:DNA-binding MarR family transcriptional regulator
MIGQVGSSRLVSALKEKGLVREGLSASDKRIRELFLTPRGSRAFEHLEQREFETYSLAFEKLDSKSQLEFKELLVRFCKDYGTPDVATLASDPPLMPEIRKLSRVIGLVNSRIFGLDDCSPLEWHILAKLALSSREVVAAELAALFGVPQNTISGVLARLAARNLLKSVSSPGDRRLKLLMLSKRGKVEYQKIELHAVRQIENGLRHFHQDQIVAFATYWERYTGEISASDELFLGHGYSLRRLESANDLLKARVLIMRGRIKEQLLSDIPETIAAPSSYVFGLFRAQEIRGAIEFSVNPHKREAALLHAIVEKESTETVLECWQTLLRQLSSLCGVKIAYVKGARVSKQLWELIPHQAGADHAALTDLYTT